MSDSGRLENGANPGRDTTPPDVGERHIALEDIMRAIAEGAFVSPCGTEGCRWEGFPEWPEEFPYDAFGDEES